MEDLQFQLEEQDVISGDKLEVVEEGTQLKLTQLEEQLAREREESSKLHQILKTQVRKMKTHLLPYYYYTIYIHIITPEL